MALSGVLEKELDFSAHQGTEIACFLPAYCIELRTWIADSLRDCLSRLLITPELMSPVPTYSLCMNCASLEL